MKQTSRKRLLISSVAMLLVAMLALGTATYAWFTTSTSATASGVSLGTSKSSELVLSKSDLDWDDTIDYATSNQSFKPISSADGLNWYSAVAAEKTEFTAKTGSYEKQTTLTNYVFDEMLNIKNKGGSECKGVTITVSSTTTSGFVRVAIVPVAAQTTAGTKPSVTASTFKANIYGATAADTWKPYNGTAVESTNYSTVAAINGATISVGDMAANAVKSYRILAWFEGEDANCFDQTTSTLTMPNLSFSVTGSSNN